jgi:hypothetical protein
MWLKGSQSIWGEKLVIIIQDHYPAVFDRLQQIIDIQVIERVSIVDLAIWYRWGNLADRGDQDVCLPSV